MPTLVLLRHGQSQWNLEDRFTGWVDVDLSERGEAEAQNAGELIRREGLDLDFAFTSVLTRAIRTTDIALAACGQSWVAEEKHWRLNERHYGGLTGLDKAETAKQHGGAQVKLWRRSYDVPPPPLPPGSPYDLSGDRRYRGVAVPATESLKSTLERVAPYWEGSIAPRLAAGQTLIVGAHGNSLRAIVKLLYQLTAEAIVGVEIPTGNPLVVELDTELRPLAARYLDPERAEALPSAGSQSRATA
jgi:2,3-bisphosphoglycerate-dependent phosphoglycerate mutase